jgi:SanA protein
MKKIEKIAAGCAVAVLIAAAGMTAANLMISYGYAQYTFDNLSELHPTYCAILLGTSKWVKGGRRNLYYQYRIIAAVELYKSGLCKKIIVSGDNSTVHYNEPITMQRDLIKMGVKKEDVICDYAGFRTLDSIIRFKEIFGQTHGIVVSQKFHNTRAVYIGRKHGIELYGYNAQDVSLHSGLKTRVREFFSKVMSVLDVELLRTEPKFFGEQIKI